MQFVEGERPIPMSPLHAEERRREVLQLRVGHLRGLSANVNRPYFDDGGVRTEERPLHSPVHSANVAR